MAPHLGVREVVGAVGVEQDGLVNRSMCSDDRRAIFVCLTGQGATRHRDALPTHREVLALSWGD